MEKNIIRFCADAGGKYCPCHLAYSGDCIKCPMIQGKNKCDCDWQGVCTYNLLNHSRISPIDERKEILCDILSTEQIGDNLYLIKIKVPKDIAKYLYEPGVYVFLKDKDKNSDIFNAPITVMDINEEEGILEVIIHAIGAKTKPIINNDKVYVKSPYYNGIFGLKEIKSNKEDNCLIVINGLSQANVINVIRRLLRNNNNVEVFVNRTLLDIIKEKIESMNVKINYFNIEKDKQILFNYIKDKKISFVYCAASVEFSRQIMNILNSVDKNIKLSISNNNLICCGEGICGACIVDLNGKKVKTCKAQIDSREYLTHIK